VSIDGLVDFKKIFSSKLEIVNFGEVISRTSPVGELSFDESHISLEGSVRDGLLSRRFGRVWKLGGVNGTEEGWCYSVNPNGQAWPDYELSEFETGSTDMNIPVHCIEIGEEKIYGRIWIMLRPVERGGKIFERIGLMSCGWSESATKRTIMVI
jgi:hypothetical protein